MSTVPINLSGPAVTGAAPSLAYRKDTPLEGDKAAQPIADSVTFSQKALDKAQSSGDSWSSPPADAGLEEKTAYARRIEAYDEKIEDAVTLNPTYQSYADTINDPKATDDQKLQAYLDYKVDSVLADTRYGHYESTAQDTKFIWAIPNSDLMQSINSEDWSAYQGQQAASRSKDNSGFGTDPDMDMAGLIKAGANLNPLQQRVLAIDTMSGNLLFSTLNGTNASLVSDPAAQNTNMRPGFMASGKPIDTKTAIAAALSVTLKQLELSHVGSNGSSGASCRDTFLQAVQMFSQRALARNGTPISQFV